MLVEATIRVPQNSDNWDVLQDRCERLKALFVEMGQPDIEVTFTATADILGDSYIDISQL